ncbi:phosphoglycolate phosphatase [Gammaproteobacteria bacterium]
MTYQLIIFDWDGTLIDSEAHIVACFQRAALDLGLPLLSRAAVRNIIGLGLVEASAVLLPELDGVGRQTLADRYRHHYFLSAEPIPSSPFPGVEETLCRLYDNGHLLAVATGKSRRGLDRALRETNLGHFFHTTRCADETHSKPNPQMLLEILEELELNPGHAVMIGDTEYDMEMAHNAAMARIAVSYGVHEVERLQRWRPLTCLDDLPALCTWLANSPKSERSGIGT